MAAALIGMEPECEDAEGALGGLGVLGRRRALQPFDRLPVLGLFSPLPAGLLLRLDPLLPLAAFRRQAIGFLGMLTQQGDALPGFAQAVVYDPLPIALGGTKLEAARFLDRFPMPQGVGQRVRAVLLAAQVAERAFAERPWPSR